MSCLICLLFKELLQYFAVLQLKQKPLWERTTSENKDFFWKILSFSLPFNNLFGINIELFQYLSYFTFLFPWWFLKCDLGNGYLPNCLWLCRFTFTWLRWEFFLTFAFPSFNTTWQCEDIFKMSKWLILTLWLQSDLVEIP